MGDKAKKRKQHKDSLTTALSVGKRITEAFGYRQIPDIAIRLDCELKEIASILNGESLPSAPMLVAIHTATGASIDWLLTGDGLKYDRGVAESDGTLEPVTPAMWFAGEERERTGQLL
jgi:transcriptional regulator with XRE-family HTH domain